MNIETISVDALKRALAIKEQIASLENELKSVLGGAASAPAFLAGAAASKRGRPSAKAAAPASTGRRGGGISEEGRRRIAEAQRLRWAKLKGLIQPDAKTAPASAPKKPAAKGKRELSPEARARIAEAVKARWARQKAGQ